MIGIIILVILYLIYLKQPKYDDESGPQSVKRYPKACLLNDFKRGFYLFQPWSQTLCLLLNTLSFSLLYTYCIDNENVYLLARGQFQNAVVVKLKVCLLTIFNIALYLNTFNV